MTGAVPDWTHAHRRHRRLGQARPHRRPHPPRTRATRSSTSTSAATALRFTHVDLTDYGQVIDALAGVDDRHAGVDALVHLGAIPAPGIPSDVATFHNNMLATFNVF